MYVYVCKCIEIYPVSGHCIISAIQYCLSLGNIHCLCYSTPIRDFEIVTCTYPSVTSIFDTEGPVKSYRLVECG